MLKSYFKHLFTYFCMMYLTGLSSSVGNMSDCRSRDREFDPCQVPYFREIGHEIISTAILLPSSDSRRVVVGYKRSTG